MLHQWPKIPSLSFPEIGRGLSEIPEGGMGLQNVCFCPGNMLQSTVMKQQRWLDIVVTCLGWRRIYATPTIKWKKHTLLETVTLSLPSYWHMHTGDLSGESNTCWYFPTVTKRAPENNYLLSTHFCKSNEPLSIYSAEKVSLYHHLFFQEDLTEDAKTFKVPPPPFIIPPSPPDSTILIH